MKILLGVVAAVVVLGMFFGGDEDDPQGVAESPASATEEAADEPTDEELYGDEYTAQVMCERFIEDRLKSPSTAEFETEDRLLLPSKRWQIIGTVDSENSFGAMIRNDYGCQVKYKGDDEWRLKRLVGLNN